MTLRVDLTPEAEADVEEVHAWYAERGMGLAEDFRRSLDQRMVNIASHPESYPIVHRSLRRALLRRFPYCVFYVVSGTRPRLLPRSPRSTGVAIARRRLTSGCS